MDRATFPDLFGYVVGRDVTQHIFQYEGKWRTAVGHPSQEWQTMTMVNWWVNCGVHSHRIVILWC
jgi:hypothetical protein